jgi:hypothetical protein
MPVRSTLTYANLLGSTEDPDWKIYRYPFVANGPNGLPQMQPGYLFKFDATMAHVTPALSGGADDTLLDGIIIDLPDQWIEASTAADATFADGVTTAGSTTVSSATAAFVGTDVGKVMTGAGIPANAVIMSVQSATAVTLSLAATVTATAVSITIKGRTVTVNQTDQTVGVAIMGTFDGNQIHYGDAGTVTPPVALTPAAIERLQLKGIVLDPAVISGPYSP